MRQRLPVTAGYDLAVPGVGVVSPGATFEAGHLVPGCEPAGRKNGPGDGEDRAAPGAGVRDAAKDKGGNVKNT